MAGEGKTGRSGDNRRGRRDDCRDGALAGRSGDNRRRLEVVWRGSALCDGPDAILRWVAARQHGLVTTEQALEAGLSRKAIRGRASRGLLTLCLPNVWRVDQRPPDAPAKALAAVLAFEPDARISAATALHDFGVLEKAPRSVHVTVVGRRPGGAPGVVVHRGRQPHDGEAQMDRLVPRSTISQALIESAPHLGPRRLEAAIATALHRRLVRLGKLNDFLDDRPRRPGVALVKAILDLDGGPKRTRSGAEVDFVALVRGAGLPMPETNVEVLGKECDAWWPDERLVVEVDSFAWHADRVSFEVDHRRDWALRDAGIEPLRFTGRQIRDRPLWVVSETARCLALRRAA